MNLDKETVLHLYILGNVDLSDSLTLPLGLNNRFCGNVFILVKLDSHNEIPEFSATNNIKAAPISINCINGKNISIICVLKRLSIPHIFL